MSDIKKRVTAIQGNAVKNQILDTSEDGYVLTWVGIDEEWEAKPISFPLTIWADDLIGSTNSNQWINSISGNGGGGSSVTVNCQGFNFGTSVSGNGPTITQNATSTTSGQITTIQAQSVSGSGNVGGNLYLYAGNSVNNVGGSVNINSGNGSNSYNAGSINLTLGTNATQFGSQIYLNAGQGTINMITNSSIDMNTSNISMGTSGGPVEISLLGAGTGQVHQITVNQSGGTNNGDELQLISGNGGTGGTTNGGDIILTPGSAHSGGMSGYVKFAGPAFTASTGGTTTISLTNNSIGISGGPQTATQNSWISVKQSDGTIVWIPCWK